MSERILSTLETLIKLGGISPTSLSKLRKEDSSFPQPIKLPGLTGYREADLDTWIRAQSTTQARQAASGSTLPSP